MTFINFLGLAGPQELSLNLSHICALAHVPVTPVTTDARLRQTCYDAPCFLLSADDAASQFLPQQCVVALS